MTKTHRVVDDVHSLRDEIQMRYFRNQFKQQDIYIPNGKESLFEFNDGCLYRAEVYQFLTTDGVPVPSRTYSFKSVSSADRKDVYANVLNLLESELHTNSNSRFAWRILPQDWYEEQKATFVHLCDYNYDNYLPCNMYCVRLRLFVEP